MAENPKPPGPVPGTRAKLGPRIVGPVAPPVYRPGAKPGMYKPPTAPVAEPLVTEGMKARQRDVQKKRRVLAMLQQVEAEEAEDRWRRVRRWIYGFVVALVALGVFLKIQMTYGDRWPPLAVWIFLGTVLFAVLTWMFWYLDYSD